MEFLEHKFVLDETFAVRTALNEDDRLGIGNWIRGAQTQSDWQVYGVHCHESGPDGDFHGHSRLSPPHFLVDFAHWAIDQGCAAFVGHGPHFLRGIEIYKNRPIFYSLGNFIFQNESVLWLPHEAYRRFGLDFNSTPRRLPGHPLRRRHPRLLPPTPCSGRAWWRCATTPAAT